MDLDRRYRKIQETGSIVRRACAKSPFAHNESFWTRSRLNLHWGEDWKQEQTSTKLLGIMVEEI